MSLITRETPQQIFDRLSAQFSAEVLGGGSIIPESNEWYVVTNDVAATVTFNAISDQLLREQDPRYACCENLIAMAALDGVFPMPATGGQGYVEVTGTVGATVPTTLQFSAGDQKFTSQGTLPSVIPASGSIVVRIVADVPGVDSNVTGTTSMTLDTAATGINTTASVYGSGLCNGADAEGCEAFRTRYLNRLKYKPRSTLAYILEKATEWPCVTRAIHRCCVDEGDTADCCTDCTTTLDFYVLMDDTFDCGIPPDCVVEEIKEWMFGTPSGYGKGQVEFGICGCVYAPKPVTVDIKIDGLACLSQSDRTLVSEAITDYFKVLEPSSTVCSRSVTSAIDKIVSDPCSFEVEMTPSDTTNVHETFCGDLDFDCDYMPCLGTIEFANDSFVDGVCA